MNFKGRIFILCVFSKKKKYDLDYIYQWTGDYTTIVHDLSFFNKSDWWGRVDLIGSLNHTPPTLLFLFSSKQFDEFFKFFITENVKAEKKTSER